jgi:hypothetical protein
MSTYEVLVDDNFHYMDERHRWRLGLFSTSDEAVAACRRIVDQCLAEAYEPGMTPDRLYELYVMFGDDPFIFTANGDQLFSAWAYARERAAHMCAHC